MMYKIAHMNDPEQIYTGGGFLLTKYLKVEHASSLATDPAGTNQLSPIENDVIASSLS